MFFAPRICTPSQSALNAFSAVIKTRAECFGAEKQNAWKTNPRFKRLSTHSARIALHIFSLAGKIILRVHRDPYHPQFIDEQTGLAWFFSLERATQLASAEVGMRRGPPTPEPGVRHLPPSLSHQRTAPRIRGYFTFSLGMHYWGWTKTPVSFILLPSIKTTSTLTTVNTVLELSLGSHCLEVPSYVGPKYFSLYFEAFLFAIPFL